MELKTSLDIPFPYGQLFEQYDHFNKVQSSMLDAVLNTDKSVVLSAPTGSGKTVAFELAIVRMLQQQKDVHKPSHDLMPLKAIYVAPIKALCAEKFLNWKLRFETLGVSCVQITGDSDVADLLAIRGAQLIVTTPEKWDSLTRRWREYIDVVSAVRLFMIDEVHLLNDDSRGPILEAIVSRMKTIGAEKANFEIRFIVASATIPNIEDLTSWISGVGGAAGSWKNNTNVTQLVYSDMQRPVPLEKYILGFNSKLKGFQFDMSLNYKLADILRKYSDRKATLIFCNSRKSTEMAAATFEKNSKIFALSDQQKTNLAQLAQRLQDTKLQKLIVHGIAFHHAGMTYDDRSLIEDCFRKSLIMILFCTNTLAMGVNLPAHLVIIKSTESYLNGSLVEYPESTLLQMIGRAGRPQYDNKGVAVIMTHYRNVRKYENLMNGKMPVESHLHKHLTEHINSEIALNTINNLEVAMNWIRSTYLYVRTVRSPEKYGLNSKMDKDIIEKKLEEMCLVQINELNSAGLISQNLESGLDVKTTSYGKLMAKYYLRFETMKLFRQICGTASFLDIFNMIVRCQEFAEFTLRVNEKRVLNDLNDRLIRFPISGRIKTRDDKISCLIQANFDNLQILSPALNQESLKMIRIGDRVAKCLLEYMRLAVNQSNNNNNNNGDKIYDDLQFGEGFCYKALLHAVTIAKCFHAKLWENSEYAAKQLRKIGAVYSSLLVNAGKTTLKSIAETDARTIERLLKKSYPFGDEVLQHLLTFPEYSLQLGLKSANMLHIHVMQTNEGYIFNSSNAVIIIGDSSNNLLLFNEKLDDIILEYGFFERIIKIPDLDVENMYAHVIHTTLVGVDAHTCIVINKTKQQTEKTVVKRKRQLTLDATLMPAKKIKLNLNSHGCGKNETVNVSSIPDDSLINLQQFIFSKKKLQKSINTIANDDSLYAPVASKQSYTFEKVEPNIPQKQFEIQNVTSTSFLTQMKITKYFNNSKKLKESGEITKEFIAEKKVPKEEENNKRDLEKNLQDETSIVVNDHIQTSPYMKSNALKNYVSVTNTNLLEKENNLLIEQQNLKPLDLSKETYIRSSMKQCPTNAEHNEYMNKKFTVDNDTTDAVASLLSGFTLISNESNKRVNNKKLDLFVKKPSALFGNDVNAINCNYPVKSVTKPIQSCPTESSFLQWYKVTKAFTKLMPGKQNFSGFKSLYHKINSNDPNCKPATAPQISSFKMDDDQIPHISSTAADNIDKRTPFTYAANNTTTTTTINKTQMSTTSMTAMPPLTQVQQNQKSNPYRLQIFENISDPVKPPLAAASISRQLNRSTVNQINRDVMDYVLNAKCEENNNDSLMDYDDILNNIDVVMLSPIEQTNFPKSFEELCRLYLKTSQDNIK